MRTNRTDAISAQISTPAPNCFANAALASRQCSVNSRKRPFTASRLAKIHSSRSLRSCSMSHMRTQPTKQNLSDIRL